MLHQSITPAIDTADTQAEKPVAGHWVGDHAELKVRIQRALQAALGDTYDCTRVWSAWSYGTMDENDFVPVLDRNDELVEEIANTVLGLDLPPEAICPECQGEKPIDWDHCGPCTNWLMGREP